MISQAKKCLRLIHQEQEVYRKCGIVLLDLVQKSEITDDLFMERADPERIRLMEALDAINTRFGKGTVFFAAMVREESAFGEVLRLFC